MGWQAYANELAARGKSLGAASGAKGAIVAAMAASTLAAAGSMRAFDDSLANRPESSGVRAVVESYASARQPVGQYVLDEFEQSEREQAAFEGADLDLEGRKEAGRQRMLRRLMASETYLETLRRERRELSQGSWSESQRPLVDERLRQLEGREAEARELLAIAEQAEAQDSEQMEAQLGAWLDRWEAEHGEPYRPGQPYAEDLIDSLQPGDRGAPWAGGGGEQGAWGSEEGASSFEWSGEEEPEAPQAGAIQVLTGEEVPAGDVAEPDAAEEPTPEESTPTLPRLARVTASQLDLRAGLGAHTASVRVLLGGTPVMVRTVESHGWVSVEAPAVEGYVDVRHLDVRGAEGVVRTSHLRLRAGPSGQALTRALLTRGTQLRLGTIQPSGWAQVTGPAVTAYVDGRHLSD